MQYPKIRDSLKTGDIVLFSGSGFISNLIKIATKSKWSHVGMIIRMPEYNFVGLIESTTLSKVKDISTGSFVKGVQLVPMSERVRTYKGDIAVRQLMDVEFSEEDIENLMELRRELTGKSYEANWLELVRSACNGFLRNRREDLSTVFCSEAVAEMYQCLRLLPNDKPSNSYDPAAFGQKENIQLLCGWLNYENLIKIGRKKWINF